MLAGWKGRGKQMDDDQARQEGKVIDMLEVASRRSGPSLSAVDPQEAVKEPAEGPELDEEGLPYRVCPKCAEGAFWKHPRGGGNWRCRNCDRLDTGRIPATAETLNFDEAFLARKPKVKTDV